MMRRVILIRCDGGQVPEIGTGHVVRCLDLARGLVCDAGTEVIFAMQPSEWSERVRGAGFVVEPVEADADFVALAERVSADIVILDDLGRSPVHRELQAMGKVVVSIDDPLQAAHADISVNPAFWQMGADYEGFEHSILPSDVGEGGFKSGAHKPSRDLIFASFGGFDPGGLIDGFLAAWAGADLELNCVLAVGRDQVVDAVPAGVELVRAADLTAILPRAAVAITNGGTTMLMAASMGAPVLALAQYEHQAVSARRLEALGAAQFMGSAESVDFGRVIAAARDLLAGPAKAQMMGTAGRRALPGLGRRDLVQLAGVVRKLEWDSDFFGHGIACLHPQRLSANVLRFAEAQCAAANIECLYFLCAGEDSASQDLAQANAFAEVDQRLSYRMQLLGVESVAQSSPQVSDVTVRPGELTDGEALATIAGDAYQSSRYYFDRHFPRERCQQFYRDWILKSLDGSFDHVVLVVEVAGTLAGYISCRAESANQGRIGLVGIGPEWRGQGLGARLVNAAVDWFRDQGMVTIEVVTQGRNTSAQRLYEAAGFSLAKTELWFHRWFQDDGGRPVQATETASEEIKTR